MFTPADIPCDYVTATSPELHGNCLDTNMDFII